MISIQRRTVSQGEPTQTFPLKVSVANSIGQSARNIRPVLRSVPLQYYLYVTLPPEMSHSATRSLLGYIHFPKGSAMYRFFDSFFYKSVSPIFSTSEICTCYSTHTHTMFIGAIVMEVRRKRRRRQ